MVLGINLSIYINRLNMEENKESWCCEKILQVKLETCHIFKHKTLILITDPTPFLNTTSNGNHGRG